MSILPYGKFIENTAGYEINDLNLPSAWEYIYQNRDFLLKVDQFGPVYVQADPPGDILLLRREAGQSFSSWTVWISEDGQEPFNNFFRPTVNCLRCDELPEALSTVFSYSDALAETYGLEAFLPPPRLETCLNRLTLHRDEAFLDDAARLAAYIAPEDGETTSVTFIW